MLWTMELQGVSDFMDEIDFIYTWKTSYCSHLFVFHSGEIDLSMENKSNLLIADLPSVVVLEWDVYVTISLFLIETLNI